MKQALSRFPRSVAVGAFALAFVTAPRAGAAQTPPPAEEIVQSFVEAIGGEDAVESIDYRHTVSEMSMPAMGMSVQTEMWQARPNRSLTVTSMPGMGEVRQGFDGEVAWSLDPMQGARVLTGMERDAIVRSANFDANMDFEDNYSTLESVGQGEVQGRPCWQVRMVADDHEAVGCFDVESGLLLGMTVQADTPMGPVESTMEFQDYQEFGGVLMATHIVSRAMGQEMVIDIQDVSTEPFDESIFELPAEVKAQVEGGGGD